MHATHHSNAALPDTVWTPLDKAVKYYQRIGVVSLLGHFNYRLEPGMSMVDHVSPLGAKLPLRAGRPIVSPSATKMTALLRGCDILKPNARRNEPSYTWRCMRTDGTVDQRSTIDFIVASPENFKNGASLQYKEEYRAGTDHVLLWADMPAAPNPPAAE